MKPTITIIIPAYNEENTLSIAIKEAKKAIDNLFSDYEILIFNDYSTDKTGIIADGIAKKDNKIRVIHNPKNRGIGYNYVKGVELASKNYVILFPGDNENTAEGMRTILKYVGKADIIIPYPTNPEIRTYFRRFISKFFVILMNVLMGLNLKYYNGLVLHKKELVKNIKVTTYGFAYQAEILSKLLNSGYNYMEIGSGGIRKRQYGKTKIFKLKNLASILKTVLYLFWSIKIENRKLYNKKPIKIER